jgi:hypothetical protein
VKLRPNRRNPAATGQGSPRNPRSANPRSANPRRSGRSRARIASTTAVALLAGTLGFFAVSSQGSTVHEADLGDGGVWITSDVQAKFGRLNKAAGQLDAGVAADVAAGSGIDVLQDGAAVLAWSRAAQSLKPIDVRTSQLKDASAVAPAPADPPAGTYAATTVDLRGGTLAIVDPASGKVWAQRVDPAAGVDDLGKLGTGAKPLATVGAGAALAVAEDGTVIVSSTSKDTVTTIARALPGADGVAPTSEFARPVTTKVPFRGSAVQVSAIGPDWVAYDPQSDLLHTAKDTAGVAAGIAPGSGQTTYAALQVPGPKANAVAIETATAVRMVNLTGGAAPGGVEVRETVNRSAAVAKVTRPVVLRGCVHGAWAETGRIFYGANCGRAAAVAAGSIENVSDVTLRDGVAFRVNRGLVVLNDLDNGGAWDVENNQQKLDNWDALIPPPQRDDKNKKKDQNLVDDAAAEQPPKAEPDNLTVRAGRTNKLYVLDNDTDAAGSVLAIDPQDVTQPDVPNIRVSVSADGQSIDAIVPEGMTQPFSFTYLVGNGKVKAKSRAKVSVRIAGDEVNNAPFLRKGAAKLASTSYPVLAGKRLSVPVIADWRDPESDPVTAIVSGDTLAIDGQGRIAYTAPVKPGKGAIEYLVDDGRGQQTKGQVPVEIIALTETRARPPITQPDVIRAVVGKSFQIEPLGNDIAGADPSDPDDPMHLAGDVRAVGTLTVDTNQDTGVVTVTPAAAGTFELSYAAQVGGGVTPGRIRVDAVANPDPDAPPVAVPDTATVRDQSPTMVDVLANDYSPRADVVVTQSAVAASSEDSWLQPTIYQGRWVRLVALEPAGLAENSTRRGTVRYTISDGTKTATGEINVVQKATLKLNPVVQDDKALVREGDTTSIPVLDNDTMADGIPLRIDPQSVTVLTKGAGAAFASGNVVRFVPAAKGLTAESQVVVEYAAYPEGMPERAQTGRIAVTVVPLSTAARPNLAPVARSFSSSVTAGDPLTITVPTYGVDPDGDTVTVKGIAGVDAGATDLKFGRIVSVGPSSMRYESYPTAAGTEIINYEVTDRFGAVSRAFVRVGVVAPGDPQPPVAIDDTITAAPGKKVTVPVTANDLIARGDSVELQYKELNAAEKLKGWKVDIDEYTISTTVPPEGSPVHSIVYGIDNGLFDPSRASLLVRGQAKWVNPPTATDDVAKPKPGETSTLVDVLANDTDIDSDPATLKVVEVLSPSATIEGNKVRVQILDHAYTVAYVIEDEDGARAMAVIYVPTGSQGEPFVVEGALIEMDKDSTKTVKLADYVKSPQDREIGIASAKTLSASPSGKLQVAADGANGLRLTSTDGYVGPGAVMLQVSDQQSATQKDVHTAYVSIPVQVGPKAPLMRCPSTQVNLLAGGLERRLDIPTLCRTWLPVGMTMDDVNFAAKWDKESDGVDLKQSGPGNRLVSLKAGEKAPTSDGTISISVPGSDSKGTVKVHVTGLTPPKQSTPVKAGATPTPTVPPAPPRLRPMTIQGLKEGESQQLDVASYLDSPLAAPRCSILAANVADGTGLQASHSGCVLTVRATERPSPTARINVEVSDGPDRSALGSVSVTMLGKPGAPTAVAAVPDRTAGGQARVSWTAPAYDGGAPIRSYTVAWTRGGTSTQVCTASPCTILNLRNGVDYFFTVFATNLVGDGPPSAQSNAARPDTKPGPVNGTTMSARGDGTLTITWAAPENKGSPVSKYLVRLIPAGGSGSARTQEVAAPTQTAVVTGLNNEIEYSVAVQAYNEAGPGPFGTAVSMQSAGIPPAVAAPTLRPEGPGPAKDLAVVHVSWSATRPNGPPLKSYTVFRRAAGGAWTAIARTAPNVFAATDTIPYDGQRYEYVVTATNGADKESPKSNLASFTSVGQPSTPSVSASTPTSDERAVLTVQIGKPRSGSFQSVSWSSSAGGSGTYSCGACAPGSTVTITTNVRPTTSQSFTVTTNNGTSTSSPATSNAVTPYGPTPKPRADGSSVNNRTVTFNWSLPTNGRPITRVRVTGAEAYDGPPITSISHTGDWDTNYTVRVTAYSEAGASPVLEMSRKTGLPDPVLTLRHGREIKNRLDQGCDPASPCYYAVVHVDNFLGRASCHLFAQSHSAGFSDRDYNFTLNDGGTWTSPGYWGYITYPQVTVKCTSAKQNKSITVNWRNP